MVSTPTELYHYSVSQSNPQPTHPQRALQPISPNTGWAQSTLPTPSGVTSAGNSNSTSPERTSSARSITLRSGSVLTMISPEEAWDRPVYQHRPICSDKAVGTFPQEFYRYPRAISRRCGNKWRRSAEEPLTMQQWMKSLIFF